MRIPAHLFWMAKITTASEADYTTCKHQWNTFFKNILDNCRRSHNSLQSPELLQSPFWLWFISWREQKATPCKSEAQDIGRATNVSQERNYGIRQRFSCRPNNEWISQPSNMLLKSLFLMMITGLQHLLSLEKKDPFLKQLLLYLWHGHHLQKRIKHFTLNFQHNVFHSTFRIILFPPPYSYKLLK